MKKEKEKEKKIVLSFKKIFLIAIIIILLCGFKLYLELQVFHNIEKVYPSFEENTQRYHSTEEILYNTINDNNLNSFYSSYDLSPDIIDKRLKIISYGPIEQPDTFRIKILIVCGQHGRELVTSEVCYTLVRLLQRQIRNANFTLALEGATINNVGIWIVPIANPWARTFIEENPQNNSCRRTNKNGVDLNRNYPHIPFHASDNNFYSLNVDNELGYSETYGGEEPLSEYESQAIAQHIADIKPHMLINIHSGSNDILLPYDVELKDEDEDLVHPPHYSIMTKLANYARQKVCPECKLGISSTILYPAAGTLVDYALFYQGVQLGYTLEIYQAPHIFNNHTFNSSECKDFFNPPSLLLSPSSSPSSLLFSNNDKSFLQKNNLSIIIKKWITFILIIINRLPFEII